MTKIKIAVFGINESILNGLRNQIDPGEAEIVAFIDNNTTRQKERYMGLPVLALEQVNADSVDYFLITAYSAYNEIKSQLIEYKISPNKIQVFITDYLFNFCVDLLDGINIDFIRKVYFEPCKIAKLVKRYKTLYSDYSLSKAYDEKEKEWFNSNKLISHALGGVVNGKRVMYSNSEEAFDYSIKNNFKVLECDAIQTAQGEWILAHRWEDVYRATEENYSLLTLKCLLKKLKQYPDLSCLIDIKWNDYEEYKVCICEIENIIAEISNNDIEKMVLKKQIIIEAYDEPTIKIAHEKKFEIFFTQYRNPEAVCFTKTVNLCFKYGIKVIGMGKDYAISRKRFLHIITDKNIKIFAFSTDSLDEYNRLKEYGVTGIFTNYLTDADIN